MKIKLNTSFIIYVLIALTVIYMVYKVYSPSESYCGCQTTLGDETNMLISETDQENFCNGLGCDLLHGRVINTYSGPGISARCPRMG